MFRFRDLAKLSKKMRLHSLPTYKEAKVTSTDYQAAKKAFILNLQNNEFGGWTSQPDEMKIFEK